MWSSSTHATRNSVKKYSSVEFRFLFKTLTSQNLLKNSSCLQGQFLGLGSREVLTFEPEFVFLASNDVETPKD